jgi:hypothetical protein
VEEESEGRAGEGGRAGGLVEEEEDQEGEGWSVGGWSPVESVEGGCVYRSGKSIRW